MKNGIKARPYTHKQLAAMYGVSWVTFQNWMKLIEKKIGKKIGHFYTTKQVVAIFSNLGLPEVDYFEP